MKKLPFPQNITSHMIQDMQNKNVLLISNAISLVPLLDIINSYDYIVRFNGGSNPFLLQKEKHIYGDKVDLCVLNGNFNSNFGDLNGFKDKKILFHRMVNHEKNKHILDDIIKYTEDLNIIPNSVHNEFIDKYQYASPTIGLITIFYLSEVLKLEITCLNFFQDEKITNRLTNMNVNPRHIYEKELQIYQKIKCSKINSEKAKFFI